VPPAPGILCAIGQLLADLRHDLMETHIFRYAAGDATHALDVARRLADAGDDLLAADGVPADRRQVQVRVEARYVGQSYELPITCNYREAEAWAGLAGDFHAAHKQRFGHADPDAPIEIVGIGATAIGKVDKPELPTLAKGSATPPAEALAATRNVYFEGDAPGDAGGWVPARIFDRAKLLADNLVEGPAVIEELSATTVLYPGDRARVHANGALLVECLQ
jgi:N-methylhydantoinase A